MRIWGIYACCVSRESCVPRRRAGAVAAVRERARGTGIVSGVHAPLGIVPDRSAVSRGRAAKTVQSLSPLTERV